MPAQSQQAPVFEQTLIIEASERNAVGGASSNANGDYEVILPKTVPIVAGDRISIHNTFIDTSKIDPNTISLVDDVDIEMDQVLYLRNYYTAEKLYSGEKTPANGPVLGIGKRITDNNPFVLCEFTPATHVATSNLVTYTKIYIKRATTPDWLDGLPRPKWLCDNSFAPSTIAKLWFQPQPGATPVSTTLVLSEQNTNGKDDQWAAFDIDITCVADFAFPASYTRYSKTFAMTGIYFEEPMGVQSGVALDFYPDQHVLHSTNPSYAKPYPGNSQAYVFGAISFDTPNPASDGILRPVTFRTRFTIPKGEYEPTGLCDIINTNMNRLQTTDSLEGSDRVEPTGPFTLAFNKGDTRITTTTEYCLPLVNVLDESTTFAQFSEGWSVRRLQNNYADPAAPASHPAFRTLTVPVVSVAYLPALTDTNPTPPPQLPVIVITLSEPFPDQTDYTPTNAEVQYSFTLIREDGNYPGSNFLQLSNYYNNVYIPTTPSDTTTAFAAKYMFASTSLTRNLLFFQKNTFWFGASALKLQYDEAKRRFEFPFLHSPITGTASPFAVWALNATMNGGADVEENTFVNDPKRSFYVPSNGGVAFTNLKPHHFWFDTLSFSSTILTTQTHTDSVEMTDAPSTTATTVAGTPNVTMTLGVIGKRPILPMTHGTNITAARENIGTAIGAQKNFVVPSGFEDPTQIEAPWELMTGRIDVAETDTTPIVAVALPEKAEGSSAYYIVDVQCGFDSTSLFMGSIASNDNYTRNIRTVVNRYYTENSYTSSSSDGTFYAHVGPPTALSSLRIRILDTRGQPVPNIGPDNTIFLKLMKRLL